MKFKILGMSALFLFITNATAEDINLDSDEKKYSYSVGTKIGQRLIEQFGSQPGINIDALLHGLSAIVSGEQPVITDEEANAIIQQKQQEQLAQANAKAEEKIQAGLTYLEENKNKEGVTVTDSGLQYSVVNSGEGESPNLNDSVVVHYHGTLVDGTTFDSSYDRGEPATFSLQSIIPGWQEVLQLMKPGDKWAVVLPSDLAYGQRGAGQLIGPNEVLKFDIELLEVKKSGN